VIPVVSDRPGDMDQAKRDASRTAAVAFARHLAAAWERDLRERLLGVYAIGSLAHDGFSTRYSDIDVALIAEDAEISQDLARLRGHAAVLSAEHAPKLSLFWTDRHFSVGRFPPLDRLDLLDHGIPLVERQHVRPPRPTLGEVRAYLGADPLRNWSAQVEKLNALNELTSNNRKAYLRALLYPARFAYSWTMGLMASNDAAVAWLRPHAPAGLDVHLIERALRCRNEDGDPDDLFPERAKLLRQRDACLRLAAALP
jgi:predicted nucleotidyltransferase